ncbi:MAG: NAD(+)/NADH kinase [Pseudomonadota bacterium]
MSRNIKFKTIGIITNPFAGMGENSNKKLFNDLVTKLASYHLLIASGSMGGEFLPQLSQNKKVIGEQRYFDRRDTIAATQEMALNNADLLIGIGGDGTLADIAYGVYQSGKNIPVLGIGLGSTNVGSLIRYRAADLDNLDLKNLKEEKINCVLAFHQEQLIGLGFNDCVFGTTIVGTLNGKITDLDAALRLKGQKKPGQSQPVGTPQTEVLKNGKAVITGREQKIGQIIAGPLDNRFWGKAVSGLLCWGPFTNHGAALTVSPLPLVQVNINEEIMKQAEPLNISQILFNENDCMQVRGMKPGTVLCLDGNPHFVLNKDDEIKIMFKKNVIKTLR